MYFSSAAFILLASLALMVQDSLPYNKTNTIAYPTQQSSSPSYGIPCSHKRGNDDRVTAV